MTTDQWLDKIIKQCEEIEKQVEDINQKLRGKDEYRN